MYPPMDNVKLIALHVQDASAPNRRGGYFSLICHGTVASTTIFNSTMMEE